MFFYYHLIHGLHADSSDYLSCFFFIRRLSSTGASDASLILPLAVSQNRLKTGPMRRIEDRRVTLLAEAKGEEKRHHAGDDRRQQSNRLKQSTRALVVFGSDFR